MNAYACPEIDVPSAHSPLEIQCRSPLIKQPKRKTQKKDKEVKTPCKDSVEASMISLAKKLCYQIGDIKAQDIVAGIMEAMSSGQEAELRVEVEHTPIPRRVYRLNVYIAQTGL